MVLSEFWVFQEKVDMKVSAFSFTTSLLVFVNITGTFTPLVRIEETIVPD